MNDRIRDNEISGVRKNSFWSIAASCEGSSHEDIGRQDACVITISCDGDYTFSGCADGHSSAKYGRDGADIILMVLGNCFREMFDDSRICEEDMVRFLLSRAGKRRIYFSWRELVLQKSEKLFEEDLLEENIIKEFGTTLNGILVTPNYIATVSVGDGGILLVNKNGEIQCVNGDYGDGIDTNLTFSMCSLDIELMETRVFKRSDYSYITAVTDGISKTYDLKGDFIPFIMDCIQTGGYEKTYSELTDFLSVQAADEITDDYSIVFLCLNEKETEEDEQNKSLPDLTNSLLYWSFSKHFVGMGRVCMGIRKILDDVQLLELAISICKDVSDRKNKGEVIKNPLDYLVRYYSDNEGYDISELYADEDNSNYMICTRERDNSMGCEEFFVTELIYKLLVAENLFDFAPGYVYQLETGISEYAIKENVKSVLSQECIDYLHSFYTRHLKEDEYWDSQIWLFKLLNSKLSL